MTAKSVSYQQLSDQLETVLAKLQAADVQVDDAVKLYDEGLKLITQLEAHLKDAENKIEHLKLQQTAGKG